MTSQTGILTSPKPSLNVTKKQFLEALKNDEKLQILELGRCRRNPKYWLWGDGVRHDGYVFTLDPHDLQYPVKRFPKKQYLEELVDIWLAEHILFVPKSRQIMATWLFTALYLWDAQFHFGRNNYFQSKKEEDADYLVRERAGFILEHEPCFLWPSEFNPKKNISYCSIEFSSTKSYIVGIPEGGDQIRSKVPSGVLSDEAGFQPQFEEAYKAAKPCISNGGRFTALTSANPGYFADMIGEK